MDFMDLSRICAPEVHPATMKALVQVESGFNPYAIGVVGGSLVRQPKTQAEALATINELERRGFNYSVGYAQINKHNFKQYGLTPILALNPCESLRAGSKILAKCFTTAKGKFSSQQDALMGAFSCYYSGNFQTGFKADFKGQPSYVQKIINAAAKATTPAQPIPLKPQPQLVSSQEPAQGNSDSQTGGSAPRSALVF